MKDTPIQVTGDGEAQIYTYPMISYKHHQKKQAQSYYNPLKAFCAMQKILQEKKLPFFLFSPSFFKTY